LENLEKKLNDIQKLYSQKKFQLALQKANKLIKTNKNNPVVFNYRGIILVAMKNYSDALRDFEKALIFKPDFAEAFSNMGMAYQGMKKNTDAIKCYQKAIEHDKNALHFQFNLANLYLELNKVDMALHVLQKILAQNEQLEHGHHLIAEAYIRNLKFDLAFEHHLRAHQISPQNAMNDYLLGVDYIWKGDNTNAEKHLTNAIKLNPKFTKAFFALSRIKKMTPQHDVCKAVLALNKHPDLSPEDLIFTEFTLFKIYSESKLFTESYPHLARGNLLMKKQQPFSIANIRSLFLSIKNLYHHQDEKLMPSDKSFATPVFIVGMPRSGSSLLEQILTASELIFGAGELNDIHLHLMQAVETKQAFNKVMPTIRDNYIERIGNLSNKPYIIDKLPLNFYWLGFIKRLFPNCKIIHTIRDPIDICFSIYSNLFVNGTLEFAYDEKDIVDYYHAYEDLMAFWMNELGSDILSVKYEDLVKNPVAEVPKIFDFIGIEFQNDYLAIEKNKRSVRTASDIQIRQAIHKNSVSKWQAYKPFLNTLIAAFGSNRF